MNNKSLYLCKLFNNEFVLGEKDITNDSLENCVVVNTRVAVKGSIDITFNTPFAIFEDRELYTMSQLNIKTIFCKEIKELDPLYKPYYDYRLQRHSNQSKGGIISNV